MSTLWNSRLGLILNFKTNRNGRHFGQWRADQRFPRYSSQLLTAQTTAMNLGDTDNASCVASKLTSSALTALPCNICVSGFAWQNIFPNLRAVPVTCALVRFLCACIKCYYLKWCRNFAFWSRSQAAAQELHDLGMKFLRYHRLCTILCQRSGKKWWLLKPKAHVPRL